MIRFIRNIICFLLIVLSYNAYSQTDSIPDPPLLTRVSVQPDKGFTELYWSDSVPGIDGYIFYIYNNGVGTPFPDTIWNPALRHYVYPNLSPKIYSVSYVIASYRKPGWPSIFSNVLSTIYCKTEIDTCNREIIIQWNKYKDYPKKVTEYKVLIKETENEIPTIYSVSNTTDHFTVTDFNINSLYFVTIEAILEDGTSSFSNQSSVSTTMQITPKWINADEATIDDNNNILLSFSVDPLSEINDFRLIKRNETSGVFEEIAQPSLINSFVSYTDEGADINKVNYYKLSAINNCGVPVIESNIASNIVLSFYNKDNLLYFKWNQYKEWLGSIYGYRLFVDSGDGFYEKSNLPASDTSFTLDYKELMYEISSRELCFYIDAEESNNPYGINGQSKSSTVCMTPVENITVPNIFVPNSGTDNAYFRPVLSFTPQKYHLIISDRIGNILFESRNHEESWDGNYNGIPYAQDICLWFLKVTTPTGNNISKTGTITVLNIK